MNETIKHQLNHRTIRFFKEQAVSNDVLEQLFAVMNRTATSNGLQSYSVIRITDLEKRRAIAEICKQPYVVTAPELLIFIVDSYRNKTIAQQKGYTGTNYRSMDFFFQGAADAYLAAQNVTNAIESLGMGAVYFGSILNDSQAIINILGLPELTFPILGIGFGYPADQPELKPRMPFSYKIGENTYPYHEDIMADLAAYDDEMANYYDSRQSNQKSLAFTDQVTQKFEIAPVLRSQIMRVIEAQGFDLNLKD
ncbi:NADPH-dependent oxidoreductase [Aerococcaceae bacterium zg-ZJ1578]|uniref:NADPH-dependent oxidoreductase n=1 Tax=Aerococcaceae TaxID=186827 RepID=UPI0013BADDE6|nr:MULTISPECIES: NADPH-dependent oxidoreductase [unclassified Facklamia]MBK0347171.1 NADPH-dependent oxidoreductase [Aerococcaceae bacterium zg-1578]NEW65110.1 NADPH-dependent oxidoreductase [Facklamia sp. 252]NEW68640.1 NADPH-dependent oxidoreductase [Facklamia sp. 253]QQD65507.1 NADPH-dependent oxidoreductase [Aerococcaceae bacterium zg-252]